MIVGDLERQNDGGAVGAVGAVPVEPQCGIVGWGNLVLADGQWVCGSLAGRGSCLKAPKNFLARVLHKKHHKTPQNYKDNDNANKNSHCATMVSSLPCA